MNVAKLTSVENCRLQPGPNFSVDLRVGHAPHNGANALRLASGATPRISLQAASVTAQPAKTCCGVCPSLTFRGMKPFETVDHLPFQGHYQEIVGAGDKIELAFSAWEAGRPVFQRTTAMYYGW